MICHRCLVSGRVQGVFFRDSTRRLASELGLRGWVRNRRDGRVEVLAAGEEAAWRQLRNWLQIGPQAAKVTNIECIDEPCRPDELPAGFVIEATA